MCRESLSVSNAGSEEEDAWGYMSYEVVHHIKAQAHPEEE
jgi:hypothetical protein